MKISFDILKKCTFNYLYVTFILIFIHINFYSHQMMFYKLIKANFDEQFTTPIM